MSELADGVRRGDPRTLARAATLIENRSDRAEALLAELFPQTGRAVIVGITGAPGSGKSTLVDGLTALYRAEGKTVGVIAVDPTSPYSGGAILGDRIRMLRHTGDPGVFIRSMATRGQLGGLARTTMDIALLLDAAGRDVVLIETVGVGQAEVEVARLADVTVVVLVPGLGDDVQTLKAGIMEVAGLFVINKADLPGAAKLERDVRNSLALAHGGDGWMPEIVQTVAHEGRGLSDVVAAIERVRTRGTGREHGAQLWRERLREMLRERLMDRLPGFELERGAADVAERRRNPYAVIEDILGRFYQGGS